MYVFNTNSKKINSSDIYLCTCMYLPDHLHHKVHYFPSRHQFFQLCMYIYSHIMLAWLSVRNLPHLQGKINTLSLKVCEKEFVTFANWTILQYHSFSGYNFLFSLPRLHLFAAIGMNDTSTESMPLQPSATWPLSQQISSSIPCNIHINIFPNII